MANQEMEFFVHTQGKKPQVIHAALGEPLCDVLVRAGVIQQGQDDLLIFVGESEGALHEPDGVEDGADEHSPVDASLTLEKLDLHQHRHVHVHRCRHVDVDVNFNEHTEHRKCSPAATVGVVTLWAKRKLRLDAAAADDYVLQLCGSTERPRADKHLGELVQDKCALCFDIVREITPQG